MESPSQSSDSVAWMRTDEVDDMEGSGDEVAMASLWKLPAYSTIA
jgi:hypothetical protein